MDDMAIQMMRWSGRGYCCSQILVLLALDGLGRGNPGLVRAMHGLCHGMGHSGEVCGVLSGGVCLLGYYAGKGTDDETGHPTFPVMVQELVEWFRKDAGVDAGACSHKGEAGEDSSRCRSVRCSDILGESGGRPDPARCGDILSRTYAKVLEILINEGFDPLNEAPEEDE